MLLALALRQFAQKLVHPFVSRPRDGRTEVAKGFAISSVCLELVGPRPNGVFSLPLVVFSGRWCAADDEDDDNDDDDDHG